MSISIGSACLPGDGTDAESLLAAADRSMYTAKNSRQRKIQQPGSQAYPLSSGAVN